jgi:hypothetical protein
MRVLGFILFFLAGFWVWCVLLMLWGRIRGVQTIDVRQNAGCISAILAIWPASLAMLLTAATLGNLFGYPEFKLDTIPTVILYLSPLVIIALFFGIFALLYMTSEEYAEEQAAEQAAEQRALKEQREAEEAHQRALEEQQRTERQKAEQAQAIEESGRQKLRHYLTEIRRYVRTMTGDSDDDLAIEAIDSAVDSILNDPEITRSHIQSAPIQTDIQLILRLLDEKGYGRDMVTERIREHMVQQG